MRLKLPMQPLYRQLWRIFSSVKLAVILIIIIALLSIAGTLILQEDVADISKIKEAYSPAAFKVLHSLGLFNLFHSWWYIAALVLLSINLAVCSLNKLPGSWRLIRRPKMAPDHQSLQSLKNREVMELPPGASVNQIISPAFKKFRIKPMKLPPEKANCYFAQKHSFRRLGYLFIHLSILIILLGAMISSLFSFKGYLGLLEGEAADSFILMPKGNEKLLGFTLRADKCQVVYYKDNPQVVKDWLSTLTIIEKGQPQLTRTIEVNHPLKYKGIYFYQEGFIPQGGYSIKRLLLSLQKKGQDQSRREFAANPGDSINYENLTIKVLSFLPDLIIEDGEAKSKSNQLNNPAVKVEIVLSEGKVIPLWVFARHPAVHQPAELDIELALKVEADFYPWIRIQVVKDPGIPIIWTGCSLLAFAVIATFYFSYQRYWAYAMRDKNGREVLLLAGSADRNQPAFARHFKALADEIKSRIEEL